MPDEQARRQEERGRTQQEAMIEAIRQVEKERAERRKTPEKIARGSSNDMPTVNAKDFAVRLNRRST